MSWAKPIKKQSPERNPYSYGNIFIGQLHKFQFYGNLNDFNSIQIRVNSCWSLKVDTIKSSFKKLTDS